MAYTWQTTHSQRDAIKKVIQSGCGKHIVYTIDRIHKDVTS